ncbi:response regulator transcription factor [Streptomyces sp. NBC_01351]|uniref:response regulator transcription factor n=1 Tax=Streptomyces sp. NBC_01351 TaxID=2903833 RepID=UPI002E3172E0|nr:response regulator transcription factor [Streptomyces sp. NBC_01351]
MKRNRHPVGTEELGHSHPLELKTVHEKLGEFMAYQERRISEVALDGPTLGVASGDYDEGAGQPEVDNRSNHSGLTPRELQVLTGIREGLSNRRVGRTLGISERTVKVHLHSIFIKLGATSRTEAVVRGIRNGCISI